MDLSHKAACEFWNQYSDKMIYRVVSFMEAVEFWTLDGNPQVEEAMEQLGKELEDLTNVSFEKIKKQDLFVSIGNAIYSGRNLRLMQAIDTAQPGSASKLLLPELHPLLQFVLLAMSRSNEGHKPFHTWRS